MTGSKYQSFIESSSITGSNAPYIEAHYHEVGRFPVAAGKDFIVLAENGRAALSRFGDRQLPCFANGPGEASSAYHVIAK